MWRKLRLANAASTHAPAGFTLVELLVVIGILAMLMALLTPVVFQARASSKNAAIKAEIDMLHMAIMNYKNEYGSFPPCYVPTINGSDAASKHLQRIFPRCSTVTNEFSTVLSGKNPAFITPGNGLAFWLSGYTSNPVLPLTGGSRQKLFDMDATRLDSTTGLYWPSGKSGSPYVYIDKSQYGLIVSGSSNNPITVGSSTYRGEVFSATQFFNADTFQILCAGADETFGNDDDLSNFWKGTRKEYLDSL